MLLSTKVEIDNDKPCMQMRGLLFYDFTAEKGVNRAFAEVYLDAILPQRKELMEFTQRYT